MTAVKIGGIPLTLTSQNMYSGVPGWHVYTSLDVQIHLDIRELCMVHNVCYGLYETKSSLLEIRDGPPSFH